MRALPVDPEVGGIVSPALRQPDDADRRHRDARPCEAHRSDPHRAAGTGRDRSASTLFAGVSSRRGRTGLAEASKNHTFNAKSETLAKLPTFRDSFKRRRCLVVNDGWYEWIVIGKRKTPHLLHMPEMESFGIAGLWSAWKSPEGEIIESATMVTRPTVGPMARIHTRMPIILRDEAFEAWLDPGTT